MRRFLIVIFVCCLAVPARVSAQSAAEYVRRGDDLHIKGEYDKAIADFNQALAIDPKNTDAYVSRGIAWDAKHEHDKAIADFNQALAIDPKSDDVYFHRGMAWAEKGEYHKAIADYAKQLTIDPKDDSAYGSLASIYATCPDAKYRDGKKAVENAKKAYQFSGKKDWLDLDTLASAYAESGDFAKAREFQAKAIELAPKALKQDFRSRLELYNQGKPFHEPPVKK